MQPCRSHLLLDSRKVGEIDHHRVKAPLEPAIECVQITPVWPRSRHTVPPIQLLLEYLTAHLLQVIGALLPRPHTLVADRLSALAGDLPDGQYSMCLKHKG